MDVDACFVDVQLVRLTLSILTLTLRYCVNCLFWTGESTERQMHRLLTVPVVPGDPHSSCDPHPHDQLLADAATNRYPLLHQATAPDVLQDTRCSSVGAFPPHAAA